MLFRSFTTSYVATGSSQPIKLEVQFNNYENVHSLKLEWRKTGSSTWYDVDNSFYLDYAVYPISVGSDLISNLDYMVVGKSLSEINARISKFRSASNIAWARDPAPDESNTIRNLNII